MLKKGDVILILLIIVVVAGSFAGLTLYNGTEGNEIAVIKQGDKIIREINLDKVQKPERITVQGKYNDVILVEKGRIRFEEADCQDLVCVETGWLTKKGQVAACLPNRVLIRIKGDNNKVDDTTY